MNFNEEIKRPQQDDGDQTKRHCAKNVSRISTINPINSMQYLKIHEH